MKVRIKGTVFGSLGSLAAGMLGWVLPRAFAWPLNSIFIAVWLVSTTLLCIGIVLAAWLLFKRAPRAQRPWTLRGVASLALFWILLFILFNLGPGNDFEPVLPLSRAAIAAPQAIITVMLVVLVILGWGDLADSELWTSRTKPESNRQTP